MTIARWPNVVTGPVGNRMAQFLETYPNADDIYITSGMDGDHGAVSHHYGLTYAGSPTAALDIGARGMTPEGNVKMRDFAKWLYDNYADFTVELIHSTPFDDDDGFYVKNQIRNPGGSVYGGPQTIGHYDHIHWATSADLMTRIEQRAGESAPDRVHPSTAGTSTPTSVANTSPVWGFDASDYDWDRGPMNLLAAQRDGISFFTHKSTEGSDWRAAHFQEALERARGAEIPVLGAYHFLWPDNIEQQVNFWMDTVDQQVPWWKVVPWIWQIDAEESNSMPRPPNPDEISLAVDLLRQRMTEQSACGYVIAYAPKWLYGDTLDGSYDIWNSNYQGSGAPRPFKDQYQGVTDFQAGWNPMSGRKPRILQFASDAVIGTQNTCCVDKFDGDLYELIRLCGREPALVNGTVSPTDIAAA
ncbi:GH25 family lysozyme [Nocardia tengchongensis]|uniref:GH25 family lysozyme n=1 Tax=Nocardia tengchongensis TaxID=2055889 RepID=UPI00365F6085